MVSDVKVNESYASTMFYYLVFMVAGEIGLAIAGEATAGNFRPLFSIATLESGNGNAGNFRPRFLCSPECTGLQTKCASLGLKFVPLELLMCFGCHIHPTLAGGMKAFSNTHPELPTGARVGGGRSPAIASGMTIAGNCRPLFSFAMGICNPTCVVRTGPYSRPHTPAPQMVMSRRRHRARPSGTSPTQAPSHRKSDGTGLLTLTANLRKSRQGPFRCDLRMDGW